MSVIRLTVGLVIAVCGGLTPSVAAADCPADDDFGNCGQNYSIPSWTDAGGWTDPAKYSTIQLADVNGDGTDELIGRNDAGVEIWRFDTKVGQWRPQVTGPKNTPQILTQLASFPSYKESAAGNPNRPQYYSTIQAADVDGQPGEEILARLADGMHVFHYQPSTGTAIDGGTWVETYKGGVFSDADGYGDAGLYSTIGVGQFAGKAYLFARKPGGGMTFYAWSGQSGFTPATAPDAFGGGECLGESCYLNVTTARVTTQGKGDELMGRPYGGVELWDLSSSGSWSKADGSGVFADAASSADCPFSRAGASGGGSGDCFGSSPVYWETLRAANLDGAPGDELLARAQDGVRVKQWVPAQGGTAAHWNALATLGPPLAGSLWGGSGIFPGQYGSIRAADVDGDGKDEILAGDGTALRAWSYNPAANAWSQLPDNHPITMKVDPWSRQPEYYSTIQTGDVDGDGREDVVARGPYGMRTFFYNRTGSGGWERYLPAAYPAWTTGQQTALTALEQLLEKDNQLPAAHVRDVYTAENAADRADLDTLMGNLYRVGNCMDDVNGKNACVGPEGVNVDDWNTVVNQLILEVGAAQQVSSFFDDLNEVRGDLLIAENSTLPAIGDRLGLSAAAGSTATFSMQSLWSTIFGIAGSLAGLVEPEAGAALGVASYLIAAIPGTSDSSDDTYRSSYAGLQDEFTQQAQEITKGLQVQSQQIRQDYSLMLAVGQMRATGAWTMDKIGMESAGAQAFTTWVYKSLAPQVYDRYQITNCHDNWGGIEILGIPADLCQQMPGQTGVIGSGQNFTYIGDQMQQDIIPCSTQTPVQTCWFAGHTASGDVLNRIWGDITTPGNAHCLYLAGQSTTKWTYGCPLGVDINTTLGQNTWGFTSYTGSPWVDDWSRTATHAQAARRAAVTFGRRRAADGRAQLRAHVTIPNGTRLAGATLRLDRILHDEPAAHGELSHPRGTRKSLPLTLRWAGPGHYTAASTGAREVRVSLRRIEQTPHYELTISAPAFRAPRACQALPVSVSSTSAPLHLRTRAVLLDGKSRLRLKLDHHLECERDASGTVRRLVPMRNAVHPKRGGLAVSLDGPRRVKPGTTARFVAEVRNRRGKGDRAVTSLWDVKVQGSRSRIRELRSGDARKVVVRVRVPRNVSGRFCTTLAASAPGTRAAKARACTKVR